MTEDKRKKIITGCIIAGMVVLIIVLTTVILKVKKQKLELQTRQIRRNTAHLR